MMNKKKCTNLIKILIVSIIKLEKEMTDFIISCNKNKSLISIVAERKSDTIPLKQIIDLLELNDKEANDFICEIYNIANTTNINKKVDILMKKYEENFYT